MLKKTALGLIIVAIIIIGAFFIISRINAPASPVEVNTDNLSANSQNEETTQPWIEILAGKVTLRQADGTLFELQSGDEIFSGSVVVTEEKGLAIIHLPDGSSVQIDINSEVRFDEANYNSDEDSLRVKIALTAGRIWSQIVELVTPDSYWEVKTANGVAAVRGASFGMEYVDGETQIIGSENTVEVQPIDPENGEVINDNVAKVTADKILSINQETVAGLKAKRLHLANEIRAVTPQLLEKPWIKRAILRDRIISQEIEKWKQAGMSKLEIRQALRRELLDSRHLFLQQLIKRVQQNSSGELIESSGVASSSGDPILDDTTTASDTGVVSDGRAEPVSIYTLEI